MLDWGKTQVSERCYKVNLNRLLIEGGDIFCFQNNHYFFAGLPDGTLSI